MFTGLIQALGKIHPLGNDRYAIAVCHPSSSRIVRDLEIGDSVAVDGVCLTVETCLPDGFSATVSPETLQRSRLGRINPAVDLVNLETSARIGSKLGGHFVTGHVDGVGCLVESVISQRAWEMTFAPVSALSEEWERSVGRYLVEKGSIAVNGISLTVADCDRAGSWFKVAVIPHTYEQTNLHALQVGSWVNLESDILGKYVDKLLRDRAQPSNVKEEISLTFLGEHGYL
ncbi:riboflavin synthase [Lusitaniella coriacea LEGE 07157]|uniref:Riboflavin synthase n=1 Tax=Lusitaniella coriacea LEGE 07157 TaxID=945747 RepID=A0A8J7DWY1_9CYAN|nr:riboflavin synthase [Lusitaniella coriacea]MBE9116622.1 riboflavin synthase [Lusitaniella coriacea LEGE 07157]